MLLAKPACSKPLAEARFPPLLLQKGIWKVCFIHKGVLQQKIDAYENHTGLHSTTRCLCRLYSAEKKSSCNRKLSFSSSEEAT